MSVKTFLHRFWSEDDAQDLVEYALLLAFVCLSAVALVSSMGLSVKGILSSLKGVLSSATTGVS